MGLLVGLLVPAFGTMGFWYRLLVPGTTKEVNFQSFSYIEGAFDTRYEALRGFFYKAFGTRYDQRGKFSEFFVY